MDFHPIKIPDADKMHHPEFLTEYIDVTQASIHHYIDLELSKELYITSNQELQYDMMKPIQMWMTGAQTNEECSFFFENIKQNYNVSVGDFVKCCLKIVNMTNEIICLCTMDENFKLQEICMKLQESIQKNIVTNKSLYLNF